MAAENQRGAISPRNVDTVRYRVVHDLPESAALRDTPAPNRPAMPAVGQVFKFWPYGTAIGDISGLGPVVLNGEIAEWEKAGWIVREPPASRPEPKQPAAASADAPAAV